MALSRDALRGQLLSYLTHCFVDDIGLLHLSCNALKLFPSASNCDRLAEPLVEDLVRNFINKVDNPSIAVEWLSALH